MRRLKPATTSDFRCLRVFDVFYEELVIKKIFIKHPFLRLRTIGLLLLALLLIFLDKNYNEFMWLRKGTAYVFAPLQYLAVLPSHLLHNTTSYFTRQSKLLTQNTQLQAENLQLQVKLQRVQFLENENAELHLLLNSANKIQGALVLTKVLAFDFAAGWQQLIIDKGKSDNIYVGQAVLDSNGVIGQVNFVGPTTSKVLLLSDTKSALPVMDVRNGLQAIVLGTGNPDSLELTNVAETMDVQVGDTLVSSTFNKNFPEGYPVGVVTGIKRVPGELFMKITVMPSAHLARSRYLILLNKH